MQLTRNTPPRLPTWNDLCAHARNPQGDEQFVSAMQALRARDPSFGFKFAHFVIRTCLRDPVYQKFLELEWPNVIDVLGDQVVRNRELLRQEESTPESAALTDRANKRLFRPYNQMPCTRDTTQRRVAKALTLVPRDAPVLLLGDDDLVSVELGLAGFTNVTAVDIDSKVLAEVDRLARDYDLKIRTVRHDLSQPVPADLYGDYRLVFFDPSYSLAGVEMFLGGALEMTRRRPGVHFFLSLHVMSLMPRGLSELAQLFDAHDVEIVEFNQGFNAYPAPGRLKSLIQLVNRIVIGNRTLTTDGTAFPYFLSDAILLRKT